jgi:hypothetical protein
MRPIVIATWIKGLTLAATTDASIRSVMSACFRIAALHEFIPPMTQNPMSLIKLKRIQLAFCTQRLADRIAGNATSFRRVGGHPFGTQKISIARLDSRVGL